MKTIKVTNPISWSVVGRNGVCRTKEIIFMFYLNFRLPHDVKTTAWQSSSYLADFLFVISFYFIVLALCLLLNKRILNYTLGIVWIVVQASKKDVETIIMMMMRPREMCMAYKRNRVTYLGLYYQIIERWHFESSWMCVPTCTLQTHTVKNQFI